MKPSLVSIIIPAYNASATLSEAIQSVLDQSYPNWELLIINDGSTDDTLQVAKTFRDRRIKIYSQKNLGVSTARNKALTKIQGDFFCFLDADDIMPPNAVKARIDVFSKENEIAFVDGRTEIRSANLENLVYEYQPVFTGLPLQELIKLSDSCFFGLTWMVRRASNVNYRFREGLTHAEDLMFYIDIADQGYYAYTEECVLQYRQNPGSAMRNLTGLQEGYRYVYLEIKKSQKATNKELFLLQVKMAKIMFLSWLKQGKPVKAFKSIIYFFRNI